MSQPVIAIPIGGKRGAGRVFLVDAQDEARVRLHSWSLCTSPKSTVVYVESRFTGRILVRLHRWLMDAPAGMDVDHINGDGLDNRRANLRVCTRSQNIHNRRGARSDCASGVTGVYFIRQSQRWVADIQINGVKRRLGSFRAIDDAINARKAAESCLLS